MSELYAARASRASLTTVPAHDEHEVTGGGGGVHLAVHGGHELPAIAGGAAQLVVEDGGVEVAADDLGAGAQRHGPILHVHCLSLLGRVCVHGASVEA